MFGAVRVAKEQRHMGAIETIRAFSEAVNGQQWDRVATLTTQDFVFSGATPRPVDAQGYIAGQKAWFAGAPDFHIAFENLREEGGAVKADVRITGTHTQVLALPGLPPFPATGRSFATNDRAVFTLRGDQVATLTAEPGTPGLMEQLGIQPTRP
jgi:predicted ester cyclase